MRRDSFLRENEELRGVLNSGFERNGSVIRNVGDNHEPRQFATWCAKAIAKIGKLTGTLHDRSIEIAMRRKKAEEKVERLRESRLMRTNEELSQCDCAWSDTNGLYYSGNGRGPLAFHSIAPARNSSRYRRRRTHVCERGGPLDDRSSCTGGRGARALTNSAVGGRLCVVRVINNRLRFVVVTVLFWIKP